MASEEGMKNRQKKTRLKPQDIRTKEFSKKLFGYDPDEVEAFLIEVANAYNELLKEIEILKAKTPEHKAEQVIERARKEIEKLLQKKLDEKKRIEQEKQELELEIEKLRLTQKKIFDKLRIAILEMTKIIEEIKPNAPGKKEKREAALGNKGGAKGFKEQHRESRRGETEDKSNGSS